MMDGDGYQVTLRPSCTATNHLLLAWSIKDKILPHRYMLEEQPQSKDIAGVHM